uniref:Uncharacterized protein n=1 Tax=Rousettus aegyptiacus TaxID=9407 RepID=A0A7J8BSP5_ROUAE|nr:hypothetical protein HJG63_009576 [Rousettus aegyptiacus]
MVASWACRLNKRTKGTKFPTSTYAWVEAAPPVLILNPDNSVPPYMSLVPLKLLPQYWRSEECLSASKSMHRALKRKTGDFNSLPSHSATISAGFHSQNLWGLLLSTGTLGWELGVRLGPLHSQGGLPHPNAGVYTTSSLSLHLSMHS